MLTIKEVEKLKDWSSQYFKKDNKSIDVFDFEHELDLTLTEEENQTILIEKIKKLTTPYKNVLEINKEKINKEDINIMSDAQFKTIESKSREDYFNDNELLTRQNLNNIKTIAIYGDIGTGKTALAYRILQEFKDMKIYFIKHPKPLLIKNLGYFNILSIQDLENLQNCVVYWDEPQLTTSIYDRKTNSIIAKVCSLARQRNITLIISSSDTRVFTKHNEAYFDLWLIKDVDYSMVKNGGKIKKAIKDNSILDPEGFRLNINEFIVETRKLRDYNGKHSFKLVDFWNNEYSKPYKISEQNSEEVSE